MLVGAGALSEGTNVPLMSTTISLRGIRLVAPGGTPFPARANQELGHPVLGGLHFWRCILFCGGERSNRGQRGNGIHGLPEREDGVLGGGVECLGDDETSRRRGVLDSDGGLRSVSRKGTRG